LQDWGEGDSFASSGNGASASPGDATWAFRFFPDTPWTAPGGDFVSTPSATVPVEETPGPTTWASTPGMIGDVQSWLDSPGSDFGWIVIGEEIVLGSARKFESRENPDPALRPMLTVEFEPPASVNTASFRVTKTFSDGRNDDVQVTLTCNSGTPLQQSFVISGGGPGVNFVLSDIQGEDTVCEVTESNGPPGYTPEFNSGNGCTWQGVIADQYSCEIHNAAEPATFTVTQQWIIDGAVLEEPQTVSAVSIFCDKAISGGFFNGSEYEFSGTLSGDDAFLQVTVDTTTGPATCRAESDPVDSGVESESDCGPVTIAAGGSASCTITYTLFFEGIPSLDNAGRLALALLMLGVGIITLRRMNG
jgi:hypothetical protein